MAVKIILALTRDSVSTKWEMDFSASVSQAMLVRNVSIISMNVPLSPVLEVLVWIRTPLIYANVPQDIVDPGVRLVCTACFLLTHQTFLTSRQFLTELKPTIGILTKFLTF